MTTNATGDFFPDAWISTGDMSYALIPDPEPTAEEEELPPWPAFRVGWVTASPELTQQMILLKQASDLHSSTVNQIIIHGVAEKMFYEHTSMLRDVYSKRCKALRNALMEHLPADKVSLSDPSGGMFVWLEIESEIDTGSLLDSAVKTAKVAYVSGQAFFADRVPTNALRLSFSNLPEEKLEEAAKRLADFIVPQIST